MGRFPIGDGSQAIDRDVDSTIYLDSNRMDDDTPFFYVFLACNLTIATYDYPIIDPWKNPYEPR